jgi:protein tyrosine phosphatase (PTP) superfamily phosphohydrolase (DUF442 family)
MKQKKQEKPKSAPLHYVAVFLAVIVIPVVGCRVQECRPESGAHFSHSQLEVETKQAAQKKWAERLELPGVPNLHKVSEELYRGAQPSAEGMMRLEKLGIKTIVNLRFILSDRGKIKGTGLDYEHINTTTWNTETRNVVSFLKIVTNGNRTPVFVHCQRGVERTGTMCAVYRIVVEGWSKDEAIEEMTKGGFTGRTIRKNLLDYIRNLDVDEIKHSAGLDG